MKILTSVMLGVGLAASALLTACSPDAKRADQAQAASVAASQAEAVAAQLAAKEADELRKQEDDQEVSRRLVLGLNGVWKYIASGEVLIIHPNASGVNINVSGRIFVTAIDSVDNENMTVNLSTIQPTQGDIITLKKIPSDDGKTYHISAAMPNGQVFDLSFIRRLTNSDIAKASSTGAPVTLASALPKEEAAKPDLRPATTEVRHQGESADLPSRAASTQPAF